MLKIKTKPGYTYCISTGDLVKTKGGKLVEAYELLNGDKLLFYPMPEIVEGKGTFEEGYLIGNLLGDGYIHKVKSTGQEQFYCMIMEHDLCNLQKDYMYESARKINTNKRWKGWCWVGTKGWKMSLSDYPKQWGISHGNKIINSIIMNKGSSEFKKGIISGYFDADSYVSKIYNLISLSSISLTNLQYIQEMLASLDIYCKIRLSRKEGYNKAIGYITKTQYQLNIRGKYIKTFYEKVGFKHSRKQELLQKAISSAKFSMFQPSMEIISIEEY